MVLRKFLIGRRLPRWIPLAVILLLAFTARMSWIASARFAPSFSDDAGRYDFLGRSLAGGRGFIHPNGTATTFWPPGYPFLLAAVYKLYPHWLLADHTVRAALFVNGLLGTAVVALVYAIGMRAFGRPIATVAAGLTALFPSLVFFAGVTLSETAFTFVLLLAIWLLLEAEAREPWLRVLAGLVIGYASLVRGQALLLPLVAAPFWYASARTQTHIQQPDGEGPNFRATPPSPDRWKRVLSRVASVGLPAALVVLPWSARNYVQSHGPVLISSNAGVDFFIGHSSAADGRGRVVNDLVFRYPELPPAEAEARVSSDGVREGLKYGARHPLHEVTLSARKVFWLYSRDDDAVLWIDGHGERFVLSRGVRTVLRALSNVYYYALIVAALAGIRRWCSLQDPPRLLLLSLVVYWTLVHMAFFGAPRFHAPIMPVLALWAAAGTSAAWAALGACRRRARLRFQSERRSSDMLKA
ncbi:MAG: glycosyltransferase family 39 protein [Chloroflexota bacterium]|nr:glycosyltransferase family 39 protein [Chloroflexota bacterium]